MFPKPNRQFVQGGTYPRLGLLDLALECFLAADIQDKFWTFVLHISGLHTYLMYTYMFVDSINSNERLLKILLENTSDLKERYKLPNSCETLLK